MPGPGFWPRDGLLVSVVNSAGSCQGVNGGVALPPVSNVVVSGRLIGCAFDASGRLQPAEQPMAGGAAPMGRHSPQPHLFWGLGSLRQARVQSRGPERQETAPFEQQRRSNVVGGFK